MELDMVTDMDVDKVATMLANNKKKSPKCSKSCFMRSVPDLCLLRFASLFPPGCWSLERLQINIIWLKIVSSYIPAWLHISSGNVVIFNRLWSVFYIAQLVCSLSSIFLGFVDGVLKSPGHHNIWSHSWDEGPTQQHSKNKFFKWREKSDGIKIFAYFRKGHQSLS